MQIEILPFKLHFSSSFYYRISQEQYLYFSDPSLLPAHVSTTRISLLPLIPWKLPCQEAINDFLMTKT